MNKVTPAKKRHVKRRLVQEKPMICVGKAGASAELLKEIERQMKKQEMVKVRILKSALIKSGAKEVAHSIAEQTGASLVEVRGYTFILHKSKKNEPLDEA